MQYVFMPKWMELLAELAEQDRWISGSDQKLMHPVIFYNIAPKLYKMGLLKVRELKDDKRKKEYSLTVEGWIYANILRKLRNMVMDLG